MTTTTILILVASIMLVFILAFIFGYTMGERPDHIKHLEDVTNVMRDEINDLQQHYAILNKTVGFINDDIAKKEQQRKEIADKIREKIEESFDTDIDIHKYMDTLSDELNYCTNVTHAIKEKHDKQGKLLSATLTITYKPDEDKSDDKADAPNTEA